MRENGAHRHSPASFRDLYLRTLSLSFYRGVLEDDIGVGFKELVEDLADPSLEEGDEEDLLDNFGHITSLLLDEAIGYQGEQVGDLWQNHLLDRVLADRNLFSTAAERRDEQRLGPPSLRRVQAELETLRLLHGLALDVLQQAVVGLCQDAGPAAKAAWTSWGRSEAPRPAGRAGQLKWAMDAATDWPQLSGMLASYYADNGTGLFGRYRAFRWVIRDGNGSMEGIPSPDPIRLAQLIGYDREREVVLRNTRHFVSGAAANNLLLYGDAGTGKSSLVKALLNEFEERGLRLIEVMKEHLTDFPYIAQEVRARKERFILFVDDLSFEEHETEYKGLKALLEGGLDARPENLVVYATSNRRHLIKEVHGDRSNPGEDEIHPHETMHEKLSLSERFGVRVAFLAPDQERYLGIVTALAAQEGIAIPEDELRSRAFQWAQWQNGFSGRTARQFITDLQGEMGQERAGMKPG